MDKGNAEKNFPLIFLLRGLLFSYILTVMLLLLLALILYKVGLPERIVSIAIIAIYIIATFVAGFITGKKVPGRRFLWGLAVGCLYFVVLLVVSLAVNGSGEALGSSAGTTFVLCAGGGMLGGMLS